MDSNEAVPTVNGNRIFTLGSNGELAILRATSESYSEVSRARVLEMRNRKDYPEVQPLTCWTAPVLCDGKVYVRNTYGNIACVDLKALNSN